MKAKSTKEYSLLEVIQGTGAAIIAEEMYDADGGYFFNYLCLSAMYSEFEGGVKSELIAYMDTKVDNIMNETPAAMDLTKGT